MKTAEIVQTTQEAQQLQMPPLLIVDEVQKFLDAHELGAGDLEAMRVGEGRSNVTFGLRREGADLILRRGPRPPLPKSTHDMIREARVQKALGEQGFPVPTIRAVCEDESLLGVPFYVMDYIDGDIMTDALPEPYHTTSSRRGLTAELVSTLLKLHAVDVTHPEISSLGRPEGYLERQVQRFTQLWPINTQRDIPLVDELSALLSTHLPATQQHSVIHGDYRMGNVMYRPISEGAPPEIAAVLDWEMATLGDPLSDLGYLTATYSQRDEDGTVLDASPVTKWEGFHTRDELVKEYAAQSSLDLEFLPWYQTLALWKAAIFCEAMYTRWLRGERAGDTFAESMEQGVLQLLDKALEYSHRIPRG